MSSFANRGKQWELILDGWHDRYRLEGRAVVYRTPPPVKVLGSVERGIFRGCWLGLGPPDYAGVVAGFGRSLASTARAVAFDAKDCAAARWSFDSLEAHQARDLADWSSAGGFSFIALRLLGAGWLLPWPGLAPRWLAWWDVRSRGGTAAPGTASVGIEDLEDWARLMPRPGDWLGALP
jgi:hypothetical protein